MKKSNVMNGVLIALLAFFMACTPEMDPLNATGYEVHADCEIEDLVIPEQFNWNSTNEVVFDIEVYHGDRPLQGMRMEIYDGNYEQEGAKLIATGGTDEQGLFRNVGTVLSSKQSVFIKTFRIGVITGVEVPIVNNEVRINLNTDLTRVDMNQLISPEEGLSKKSVYALSNKTNTTFSYLSSYNGVGVPSNLSSTDRDLPQDLCDKIDASLPERKPVPQYHPQYITEGTEIDVRLTAEADLYVTFLHEGAGYRNALGFYTYDLDSPPQSVSEITNYNIIFPNVSAQGSGGNLNSGNQVHIGHFNAGTGVGWFLVVDGWINNGVQNRKGIMYSNPDFNPENAEDKRRHTVLIKDDERELCVLGFEDLNREVNSDDDFNDAVFLVDAAPYTAIETENIPPLDVVEDGDGDGISDLFDEFPTNPNVAFTTGQADGTFAFEDLWPWKGDYDYNDLVINYDFESATNHLNDVIELTGKFVITDVVAGFSNGFAIELPVDPSKIVSVSGSHLTEELFSLTASGIEAGQSQAVIPVFDNAHTVSEATITITITFDGSLEQVDLGAAPYNPFIIANQSRGTEIHLAGEAPTTLADRSLFSTGDDVTVEGSENTRYKTSLYLPWAIDIPQEFQAPKEGVSIKEGYTKFADWATSGGTNSMDWYEDKVGYRNNTKLQ